MEHDKSNIREVYFIFQGSSVIEHALESTGIYPPSLIAGWLKRNYVMDVESTRGREIDLHMIVTSERNGSIRFVAYDHRDFTADDYDFNKAAQNLAEFEISLPSATGAKDWNYYLQQKKRGIIDVQTPEDAEKKLA